MWSFVFILVNHSIVHEDKWGFDSSEHLTLSNYLDEFVKWIAFYYKVKRRKGTGFDVISLALKPILTFICLVMTNCMFQAQLKQEKQEIN